MTTPASSIPFRVGSYMITYGHEPPDGSGGLQSAGRFTPERSMPSSSIVRSVESRTARQSLAHVDGWQCCELDGLGNDGAILAALSIEQVDAECLGADAVDRELDDGVEQLIDAHDREDSIRHYATSLPAGRPGQVRSESATTRLRPNSLAR